MKKIIAYALAAVLSLGAIVTASAEEPIINEGEQQGIQAAADYDEGTLSGTGAFTRTAIRNILDELVIAFEERDDTETVIIGTKSGEVLEDFLEFPDLTEGEDVGGLPKSNISGWSVSGASSSPLFKKATLEKEKNGLATGIKIEFNEDKSTNTDDKDIKVTIRFTKGTDFVNGVFEYTYSSDVRGYDDGADISVDNGAIYEYTETDVSGSATFFFSANTRYDARISRTQGPVNLTFETGTVDLIEDEYANTDLAFFRVTGTNTFRTAGKLVIKADEGDYLYGIQGNKLVALTNWTYDRSEGAIVLTTDRLGGYVIANQNLKLSTTGTGTTGNETTVKNPNTGSSRAINGAVMFALISLAAAGAVSFKRAIK